MEQKKKRKGLRILGAVLTGGASEATRATLKGGQMAANKMKGIRKTREDLLRKRESMRKRNYDDSESFGFDQAYPSSEISAAAQEKIIQKAAPKMADYLEKHGVQNVLKESPIHLAMQVANEQEKYKREFDKMIRGKFLTEREYVRYLSTPDYKVELDKYQHEQAKAKGFMGFDGEDGSDMSTFAPLVALAPGALKLGKKAVGGLIKKIGGKALEKAKAKKTAKKQSASLQQESQKKAAQAGAIDAGVPATVVAQATRNLPPEKAAEVANDLKEVYSKGAVKEEAISAATQEGSAVQNKTMIYIIAAVAAAAVLFIVLKK